MERQTVESFRMKGTIRLTMRGRFLDSRSFRMILKETIESSKGLKLKLLFGAL
jgi:hypothetical protein